MIKQNFVIVCESAIIEKDSNNLFILGIFENMFAPNVPATHPQFAIVTSFSGGTGEHKIEIGIRHESGDEIAKLEGKILFSNTQKAQHIGRFITFPFPKFGLYKIEIYLDGALQSLVGELNVVEKK